MPLAQEEKLLKFLFKLFIFPVLYVHFAFVKSIVPVFLEPPLRPPAPGQPAPHQLHHERKNGPQNHDDKDYFNYSQYAHAGLNLPLK
jgi:hypothetical protein